MTKHTRYNFPSGEIDEFSLSSLERKYLGRTSREKMELLDWALVAAIITMILILGLLFENIVLDPMLSPAKAEAAEMKTDKDYCREIQEGKWTVVGASAEEVADYCATV